MNSLMYFEALLAVQESSAEMRAYNGWLEAANKTAALDSQPKPEMVDAWQARAAVGLLMQHEKHLQRIQLAEELKKSIALAARGEGYNAAELHAKIDLMVGRMSQ